MLWAGTGDGVLEPTRVQRPISMRVWLNVDFVLCPTSAGRAQSASDGVASSQTAGVGSDTSASSERW